MDEVWIGEHRFSRHGLVSGVWSFLGQVAARTKQIRIGTAVVVLPLHNPIQVAEEAAMVDGCNRFGAIVRVAVPLARPGLIATFLFAFIGAWNELLFAVMFLNTDANFTLPVGLYMFISKYDIHWGRMMAGATLALIPALIVFGVVQRYMVRGLALGAVKG